MERQDPIDLRLRCTSTAIVQPRGTSKPQEINPIIDWIDGISKVAIPTRSILRPLFRLSFSYLGRHPRKKSFILIHSIANSYSLHALRQVSASVIFIPTFVMHNFCLSSILLHYSGRLASPDEDSAFQHTSEYSNSAFSGYDHPATRILERIRRGYTSEAEEGKNPNRVCMLCVTKLLQCLVVSGSPLEHEGMVIIGAQLDLSVNVAIDRAAILLISNLTKVWRNPRWTLTHTASAATFAGDSAKICLEDAGLISILISALSATRLGQFALRCWAFGLTQAILSNNRQYRESIAALTRPL